MAGSTLVDAGVVVALLSRRDRHHRWVVAQASQFTLPWRTCDAALSEAFHLLGTRGGPALSALLRRGAAAVDFDLAGELEPVLTPHAQVLERPDGPR